MRRLLAVVLALLVGLSAPAFAQTASQAPANTGPVQGAARAPVQTSATPGNDAFAQAPPSDDTTTVLIGGGLLLGAGALTAIIISNSKSSGPTSP